MGCEFVSICVKQEWMKQKNLCIIGKCRRDFCFLGLLNLPSSEKGKKRVLLMMMMETRIIFLTDFFMSMKDVSTFLWSDSYD